MKHTTYSLLLGASALAFAAPATHAQGLLPLQPFSETGDVFVPCPSTDSVYRLQDLDLDGRFDSPGETVVFYSDAIGPIPLTNPNGITVGLNGVVFVSDSSEEVVVRLIDLDGDGVCHSAGEATLFFDGRPGGNQSNILTASPANLTVDFIGNVWLSVAGDGANPQDRIVRLFDSNFDGNANGTGEASVYHEFASAAGGDNIPQDVAVGTDGHLYLVDIPASGALAKGVYRLDDTNSSGVIDAGEVLPFFVPPTLASNPFFWGMTIDADGYFYLADTTNETIWRFRDDNNDKVIDNLTEAVQWWTSPGTSLIWRVAAASDGSIYAAESQTPDSILRFFDADASGTIDPLTEVETVWSDLVSAIDIVNPRSIALDRKPTVLIGATTSISSPFVINTFATEGDIALLYWSSATVEPLGVAPFGFLELNLTPGLSGLLSAGTVPFFGPFSVGAPALNLPGLVGLTFHLQALCGKPARLRLSNLASTTFTN